MAKTIASATNSWNLEQNLFCSHCNFSLEKVSELGYGSNYRKFNEEKTVISCPTFKLSHHKKGFSSNSSLEIFDSDHQDNHRPLSLTMNVFAVLLAATTLALSHLLGLLRRTVMLVTATILTSVYHKISQIFGNSLVRSRLTLAIIGHTYLNKYPTILVPCFS